MRKMLSIIGAIGLTATAASTVVSCAKTSDNNPTASIGDVQNWLKESKTKHQNQIIFIGGRTDSDSLSYMAARDYAINGNPFSSLDKLLSNDTLEGLDGNIVNETNSINDFISGSQITNATNDQAAKAENTEVYTDYLDGDVVKEYVHHSILVDDLNTFWNNGLGKDILDKVIKEQIKEFYNFNSDKQFLPNTEKDAKEFRKQLNVNFKNSISSTNGPFFLIIRNGKLVGIQTGFKNYKNFTSEANINVNGSAGDKYELKKRDNARNDIDYFYNQINNNIFNHEVNYLNSVFNSTNTTTVYEASKDLEDGTNSQGWNLGANKNTLWNQELADKKAEDANNGSTGDENTGDDGTITGDKPDDNKSYNVDFNKYMN